MNEMPLNALAEKLKRKLQDPTQIASVVELLKTETGAGVIAPDETHTMPTWGLALGVLLQRRMFAQAANVGLAWYHRLCELQLKDKKRYHKGGAVHNTGAAYLMSDALPLALWFTACAFVEDVVSTPGDDIPETPATKNLRLFFNWSEKEFRELSTVTRQIQKESEDQWWFPETALVEYARNESLVFPNSARSDPVPINGPYFSKLVGALPDGSSDQKKKTLEFLASYLCVTLPNVRIMPNVQTFAQDATFEHEIDLVVIQHSSTATYLWEALGRHFLVECKNWDKPVGVAELNHFVAKMRFHRCTCGVMFSQEGLSGDRGAASGLKHARLTQLRWYHQDGCVVIVLTGDHLKEIAAQSRTFEQVLLRGYEFVRFNGPRDFLAAVR